MEVLTKLAKLQMQTAAKLTDLEGCWRCFSVRIFGIKVGAEENTATMISFVEDLLKRLQLPTSTALNIYRVHWALTTKPLPEVLPSPAVMAAEWKAREPGEYKHHAWLQGVTPGIPVSGHLISTLSKMVSCIVSILFF